MSESDEDLGRGSYGKKDLGGKMFRRSDGDIDGRSYRRSDKRSNEDLDGRSYSDSDGNIGMGGRYPGKIMCVYFPVGSFMLITGGETSC